MRKSLEEPVLENDILLLANGRMLKVIDPAHGDNPHMGDYSMITYMDSDEQTYCNFRELNIAKNLGKSKEILAIFHAAQSIHVRLNRIKSV